MTKKMISLMLIFAMLIPLSPAVAANDTSTAPTVEEILNSYHQKAFEAEIQTETANYENAIVYDNVMITGYVDSNGNSIICEYTDGVLTQKNTIPHNQEGVILREYFEYSARSSSYNDVIHIEDFGTMTTTSSASAYVTSGYAAFGAIQYRAVDPWGAMIYPVLVVNMKETAPITTTYTINNWIGKVVDLVSILVSAGLGQIPALAAYVPALLTALGITVVAGSVSQALSTTVASRQTTFIWQVYDSEYQVESFFTGTRNYIIDDTAHHGEIYRDGITPNDWETNVMAAQFYDSTYPYTTWYVNRWTVVFGNNYV